MARPVQDSYYLRHALLSEVIEAGLLPGERASLHAALAHLLGSGESTGRTQPPEVAAQ